MNASINILATRPLDNSLVNTAKSKGILIDRLSFIETSPIKNKEIQQQIKEVEQVNSAVVFTSMNAVDAVANYLDGNQPPWKIYCIGTATNQLAMKYYGENAIAGSAYNATDLANLIVSAGTIDNVIFFCGNQRRDELLSILRQHNIAVKEIVVYQTVDTLHKIEKDYHGVLFFSPSGVKSFFLNNHINQQTILFAIGNTTASEIKKYSGNTVVVSDTPGKENLLNKMIEYFT